MTIHSGDPFAEPEAERRPIRRLRGRLVGPVTLWTSGAGAARAGLTVASTSIADGEPGHVIGLVDAESQLWTEVRQTGRLVVATLSWAQRHLADVFAGVAPAPGGPFRVASWRDTPWGPVLADATTWCGCRLETSREVGYAVLVDAVVEQVEIGADPSPLTHYRGRYRALDLGS